MKKILFAITFFLTTLFAAQNQQPKFEITDINGEKITVIGTKEGLKFPDFKNKVVLIEFWGTHCPPCLYSISHYIDLNKKYKDKMAMIAIEVQMTPPNELKAFAKKMGINYHVFAQSQVSDFVRYVGTRAGWQGAIPFLIAFDTQGNPIDIHVGYAQEKYVEALIKFGLHSSLSKENNATKESNATKKETNTTKTIKNNTPTKQSPQTSKEANKSK